MYILLANVRLKQMGDLHEENEVPFVVEPHTLIDP